MAKKKDVAPVTEKAPAKKKGTYQDRVRDEKDELDSKIVALAKFMEGDEFANLQPVEREDLTSQIGYMKRYKAVLVSRIERFADKK